MATIARIIADYENKTIASSFAHFITESKKHFKGEKHQFVLLPGGFLKFAIKNDLTHTPLSEPKDKSEKQQWNDDIENLKNQALAVFYRDFDSKMLRELKSVANYLVIGIDAEDARIQFVLVYDLQSGKPLHWTGKTYGRDTEKHLIQMPIVSHFIRIDGKKVAFLECNDISIFNPRSRRFCSPVDKERRNKTTGKIEKRKENMERQKLKCQFIDETIKFSPKIVLHLPHTEASWGAKWKQLNNWLKMLNGKELKHFASGINSVKKYPLSGTQHGDVVNFSDGKFE